MTPQQLADQIREVHRICQDWEDKPTSDSFHRPKWTRWFNMFASIILMGLSLGFALIVGQLSITTAFMAHAVVWVMWALAVGSILYGTVSVCIGAVFTLREWSDFASPFSPSDAKDLEDLIAFEERLNSFDRDVLKNVAVWLETRAKKLENARLFLVGVATLAGAVVGVLLWPNGEIRTYLDSLISLGWKVCLQLWLFALLAGGVLAIMGAWKCGTACQNRALTIRRVLSNAMTADSVTSSEKGASP